MLTRRDVLRGAGAVLALPWLESLRPAQAVSAKPGLRMAFLFVPNGIHMDAWTPSQEGGLVLTPTLASLAPVQGSINVLTGLAQRNAFALGDGPGDHARSAAAWLTGCHPFKTNGANIKAGVSVDQIAARYLGGKTRFPSLELGCERGGLAGDCDSGYSCAYSNAISWRTDTTPAAKEVIPRLVFERLFGANNTLEDSFARAQRIEEERSILDFVQGDAKRLSLKLGRTDRAKLDEYLTGVRDIERRMQFGEKMSAEAARDLKLPEGMPADYGEHIRLMGDLMVLAFQSDMTRVCTLMLANEGSNRAYRMIGINDGHHETSHHQKNPDKLAMLQKINQFHVEQLAYVLRKMQSIQEGDRTLLDNVMLVYGAGICDGDRHNHDDLPILLGGGGGGTIRGGRHLVYERNTPMANLFITMLDRAGIEIERVGDSTGKLHQLF